MLRGPMDCGYGIFTAAIRISLIAAMTASSSACANLRSRAAAAPAAVGRSVAKIPGAIAQLPKNTVEAVGDAVSPPDGLPRRTRNVALVLPTGGWWYLDNPSLFGDTRQPPLPRWRFAPIFYIAATATAIGLLVNGVKHKDSKQTTQAGAGLALIRFGDITQSTRAAIKEHR
jgi:guanyl-specific ribonuclease Sa